MSRLLCRRSALAQDAVAVAGVGELMGLRSGLHGAKEGYKVGSEVDSKVASQSRLHGQWAQMWDPQHTEVQQFVRGQLRE